MKLEQKHLDLLNRILGQGGGECVTIDFTFNFQDGGGSPENWNMKFKRQTVLSDKTIEIQDWQGKSHNEDGLECALQQVLEN